MCENILTLTLAGGQPECFYPEAEEALCDVGFALRECSQWGILRPYYTAWRPFIVARTHLDIAHDCALMRLSSCWWGRRGKPTYIKKLREKEQQKDFLRGSNFRWVYVRAATF